MGTKSVSDSPRLQPSTTCQRCKGSGVVAFTKDGKKTTRPCLFCAEPRKLITK